MSLISPVPQGLIDRIKVAEGFSALPYRDTNRYWTIGYGHLISTDATLTYDQALTLAGGAWSVNRAEASIEPAIESCRLSLDRAFPWFRNLDSARQESFTELCYNMGINHLSQFANLLKAAESAQWVVVAVELMDSLYARHVGARAKRIAIELGTGVV